MLQIENETFWQDSKMCFSSQPLIHSLENHEELWFASEHKHDIGAVQYNWYYMIPYAESWFGNQDNLLVNERRRVADERGTDWITVKPGRYTGEEMMVVKVIE